LTKACFFSDFKFEKGREMGNGVGLEAGLTRVLVVASGFVAWGGVVIFWLAVVIRRVGIVFSPVSGWGLWGRHG
jgi:hypothetical protein